MGTIKIAINGFGRIGRLALRKAIARDDVEIVAVNDLADNAALAYLFKHDSVHGTLQESVALDGDTLYVGDNAIRFTSHRDPAACGWGDLGIDVVLESTGVFTARDKAALHLDAGAKKVLISAPSPDADVTVCLGVNESAYDSSAHHVISNASCTTNCVAPVLKAVNDAFGVRFGTLNTVHAYTMNQGLLDSPSSKFRRGRAAALNLVPTSTGAAKAVGKVIPALAGKLDGLAVRTPNPTGSLADLTLLFEKAPSISDVHACLNEHAARYPDVLGVSSDELVSTDIVGDTRSSIVDTKMTMQVGEMTKLLCWYDNEAGYATRLVDMGVLVAKS